MCPPASAATPGGCSASRPRAPISPSALVSGSRGWCRIRPSAGWASWSESISGFPQALLAQLPPEQPLCLGAPGVGALDGAQAPRPSLDPAAGKYERGRLLVIAGSDTYRGAAHLALAGATASGLGSLRAVVPPAVADQLWMVLPHVVLEERPLTEGGLERLDAVLVGPGLGPVPLAAEEGESREAWWPALQAFGGLLVVDADGLNRIHPAWLRDRAGPTWITPHAGEFARLWPALAVLPPWRPPLKRRGSPGPRCC